MRQINDNTKFLNFVFNKSVRFLALSNGNKKENDVCQIISKIRTAFQRSDII